MELAHAVGNVSFDLKHDHPPSIEDGADIGPRSADQDQATAYRDGLAESIARFRVGNRNHADGNPLISRLSIGPGATAFFQHSGGPDHQKRAVHRKHRAEFVARFGAR